MLEQERLELRAGQHETAEHRVRLDVRGRHLARQRRDLAEELAATKACAFGTVDENGRLAFEDDVERAPGDALPDRALTCTEDLLLEGVRDGLELGPGQIREERELRETLGERCVGQERRD
jgi:hypothetical protein